MYTDLRIFGVGIALTALVSGCALIRPEWSMAVKNTGTVEIQQSTIRCGRLLYSPGVLIPNGQAGFYCDRAPIPKTATLRWIREGGAWHEQQVAVRSVLPPRFEGCVYFDIDNHDNVTVRPKPR